MRHKRNHRNQETERWCQPVKARVTFALGEGVAPILLPSIGSHIEPFMKPEDVEQLKGRLQDETLRRNLAAFIAERMYEIHLRQQLKNSIQTREEIMREVIKTGIAYYAGMTDLVEAESWPDSEATPEFYSLAVQDMEGRTNG